MEKTLCKSTQGFWFVGKGGLYIQKDGVIKKALSVDHIRYIKNYKLYRLICIKSVWFFGLAKMNSAANVICVESVFHCTWMMRISIAPRRLVHWFWFGHGIVICVMFFRFGIE